MSPCSFGREVAACAPGCNSNTSHLTALLICSNRNALNEGTGTPFPQTSDFAFLAVNGPVASSTRHSDPILSLRDSYENNHKPINWGPIYTMAKGRDHKVVRDLETHPKAIPWKIEIEFCVVTGLQV